MVNVYQNSPIYSLVLLSTSFPASKFFPGQLPVARLARPGYDVRETINTPSVREGGFRGYFTQQTTLPKIYLIYLHPVNLCKTCIILHLVRSKYNYLQPILFTLNIHSLNIFTITNVKCITSNKYTQILHKRLLLFRRIRLYKNGINTFLLQRKQRLHIGAQLNNPRWPEQENWSG